MLTGSSSETKVIGGPPCNNCREKHVKCKLDDTPCAYCRKTGSECIRTRNVRFSHKLNPSVRLRRRPRNNKDDYDFDRRQTWVKINRSLHFVDETHDVIFVNGPDSNTPPSFSDQEEELSVDPPIPPRSRSWSPQHVTSEGLPTPQQRAHASSGTSTGFTPLALVASRDSQVSSSQSDLFSSNSSRFDALCDAAAVSDLIASPIIESHIEALEDRAIPNENSDSTSPIFDAVADGVKDKSWKHSIHDLLLKLRWDSPSTIPIQAAHTLLHTVSGLYSTSPNWPLQDPEEAYLLHFFVENVAPFFDLCDAERQFEKTVPLRAAWCPPLLNALLSASAKRLSRISDFDGVIGDKYHQECLKSLIPALCDPKAATDENILTAVVILRYMEELDVGPAAPASQSHLIGTRVFLAAQEQVCEFKGLRLATFWVALRQEIYMAFIHGQPVHDSYALNNCDWLLMHVSDELCNYANRIIIHCAVCLRFCYSDRDQSLASWEELWQYLQDYSDNMPLGFKPIWQQPLSEAFLPQILYLNAAVLTGMQHYYLVRILLLAHDPRIPKLGPGRAAALKNSNVEIKEIVRTICGIAKSDPRIVPASVNAYVAINMAGDLFTEKHEQEALLETLENVDRDWPIGLALQHWKKAWGKDHESQDMSLDTP